MRAVCCSNACCKDSITAILEPMTSAMVATGRPCTRMSSAVTMITTFCRGFASATDSGIWMDLALGRSCTSEEFTRRKNTRMVKMSISETRFSVARRRPRVWWRCIRLARLDIFMTSDPFSAWQRLSYR